MNFRILFNFISLIALALLFQHCTETEEKCAPIPDTSAIDITIEYEPLADSFLNVTTKQQLVVLLDRHRVMRDVFFHRDEYPNDSVFINTLFNRFTNIHMDTLHMEVNRVFSDENYLKQEFTAAFENLRYYYPNSRIPKVQTVISGLDNDMFVSDSLIIVSLDYYLGKGAKYRPAMYEYLLRQYVPENIVPSCMLLYGIDSRVNKTNPADKTVLADMVAYGKAYYFAKHMVPCVADSTLIWYTAEETEGAQTNQDLIWARLIEDEVLYSTSHVIKQKYLGERPKTIEVGEKCPGRIAQWVGWQIVKKYMERYPDTTLPQVMEMSDAQALFNKSGYKPALR
jgi:hypothetical protein